MAKKMCLFQTIPLNPSTTTPLVACHHWYCYSCGLPWWYSNAWSSRKTYYEICATLLYPDPFGPWVLTQQCSPWPQSEPTMATGPSFVLLKGLESRQSTLARTLFCHLILARRTFPEQEERRSNTHSLVCPAVLRGTSLPSIPTRMRTSFKATLTSPHSHLNTQLRLTVLDPLLY